jgi:hypothetical protein
MGKLSIRPKFVYLHSKDNQTIFWERRSKKGTKLEEL